MAITISTEVDTALVTWIKTVLPATLNKILWEKASGQGARIADEPSQPYVTLSILVGPANVDGADMTKTGAVGNYKLSIVKEITLSIKYISDEDYLDGMSKLASSLENPIHLAQLRDDADIGVMEIMPVNDISELEDTKFKLRSQMDVRMTYLWTDDEVAIGQFDTVVIDTEVNGEARNQITVP